MSSNNIIRNSEAQIAHNTNKTLSNMGAEFMLFTRFMVGRKPDIQKFKKIDRLRQILANKECLIDLDFDRVNEELNNLTF